MHSSAPCLTGQRLGRLAVHTRSRRASSLPRASRGSRWKGLLEAEDKDVACGEVVADAALAVEAARQVAEKAFIQPTYQYLAVTEDEEELDDLDRLWYKLDALADELNCVTEAEYLSGLPTERPSSPRLQQPLGVSNNVLLHPNMLPTLVPPPPAPAAPELEPEPEQLQPEVEPEPEPERQRPEPPRQVAAQPEAPKAPASTYKGRAEGTGREVLLQGFNWESWKNNWYEHIRNQASEIAALGFTAIWLPPFTDSVSEQGYMPRDLYNLNSKYGSEQQLIDCVRTLQSHGLKVLGDAVLNHRCATYQGPGGVWNQFGGKMTWDERAIVGDQAEYGGRGNLSSGESFGAAPNIDHSQDFVKRDLSKWLCWLREHVGFDGWRLDFVKGFHGSHVRDYLLASEPDFCVGEYWDSLAYQFDGTPCHNQDAHRQRTINWIEAAGGYATAFDITTKGILHAVFERCEYWRLSDAKGKPPGLLGWWPSRAVTFLENHDTGSTQGHWRFPHHALEQGYVYILTHPGTPTVFYDHLYDKHNSGLRHLIGRLIELRQRMGINCRSQVKILKAERDVYAAEIDERLIMKIGPGDFSPAKDKGAAVVDCGHCWTVWERK